MTRSLTTQVLPLALSLLCAIATPALPGELEPLADRAPAELSGQTANGLPWDLENERGRVVLVTFWAGWCTPCLEEIPALEQLARRMRHRPFTLVGVNLEEPELRVQTLIRQFQISFRVLLDPDGAAFARWGAQVLPTAYLLDGQGRPRLIAQGPMDWQNPHVLAAIDHLIETSGSTVHGPQ